MHYQIIKKVTVKYNVNGLKRQLI